MQTEQIIETINKTIDNKKSQAQKRLTLFVKHKKWLKAHYETTDFTEPVLFLERRSGEVEFYEKATAGLFNYQHSDGNTRFIVLTPNKQKKFGFANRKFRGYYCHEDYPLPLPQDPLITCEQVNILIEKSLNDIQKWKTEATKAKTKMIWVILGGIAVIILAMAMYKMLAGNTPPPVIIEQAPQAVETIISNVSTGTII